MATRTKSTQVGFSQSARIKETCNGPEPSKVPKRRGRLTKSQRLSLDATRNAVFNTAELVEIIIYHLPVLRLFAARRVSKLWHDTIERSLAIRGKMFLFSDNLPPQMWIPAIQFLPQTWTPAIPHRRPALCKGKTRGEFPPVILSSRASEKTRQVRLNPVLKVNGDAFGYCKRLRTSGVHFSLTFDKHYSSLWNSAPGNEKSSWRNTYFTDPPCSWASIIAKWDVDGPFGRTTLDVLRHIEHPNGVTLGHVLDELMNGRGAVHRYDVARPFTFRDSTLREAMQTFEATFGPHRWLPPRLLGTLEWSIPGSQ